MRLLDVFLDMVARFPGQLVDGREGLGEQLIRLGEPFLEQSRALGGAGSLRNQQLIVDPALERQRLDELDGRGDHFDQRLAIPNLLQPRPVVEPDIAGAAHGEASQRQCIAEGERAHVHHGAAGLQTGARGAPYTLQNGIRRTILHDPATSRRSRANGPHGGTGPLRRPWRLESIHWTGGSLYLGR